MSRLTIQLLGAPTIAVDGQPIETDTRKATALMAYLAMQPGVHTRDHLATLLWPDLDQTRARAALRRTLSALNRTLASAWLDVTRESLALRQDATVGIDAHRFRTLAAPDAALAQLEDAAACYTGDFLAGFSLRDSPLFDDWQFFAAEELRHTLVDVLDRLGDGLARGGRFDDAIGHMRRRLQLDPLHEAAHRTLMRLYVWNDQRNAALRQYRECVRILDDELGVPPLDETTALHDEIQRNSTLPARQAQPARRLRKIMRRRRHAPGPSVLPLVRREDEVLRSGCAAPRRKRAGAGRGGGGHRQDAPAGNVPRGSARAPPRDPRHPMLRR
ncbi:MAG: BTAD domain-containing putative transcriptional regulator [Caldilineaceae bacterium]